MSSGMPLDLELVAAQAEALPIRLQTSLRPEA